MLNFQSTYSRCCIPWFIRKQKPDVVGIKYASPSSEPTTNSLCREFSGVSRASLAKRVSTTNFLPSVLPLKGFTDMSHLCTTRSLGWGALLTLGQDQPVIPGVPFIR